MWIFPYGILLKQTSKKFASEPPKLLRSPSRSSSMRKLVQALSDQHLEKCKHARESPGKWIFLHLVVYTVHRFLYTFDDKNFIKELRTLRERKLTTQQASCETPVERERRRKRRKQQGRDLLGERKEDEEQEEEEEKQEEQEEEEEEKTTRNARAAMQQLHANS